MCTENTYQTTILQCRQYVNARQAMNNSTTSFLRYVLLWLMLFTEGRYFIDLLFFSGVGGYRKNL